MTSLPNGSDRLVAPYDTTTSFPTRTRVGRSACALTTLNAFASATHAKHTTTDTRLRTRENREVVMRMRRRCTPY